MKLSNILLAVLPALALAQEEDASTTTVISTTTLTKTYTLSEVHTKIIALNTTTAAPTTTNATTSYATTATLITTTEAESTPTTVDPDNDSAGVTLDAAKIVMAGFAGMLVVALM